MMDPREKRLRVRRSIPPPIYARTTPIQLGTGVKDFFYEPAEGLMKSPTAFGKGVAKGTMSLVGNTTSGVLGFTTKITCVARRRS